jgi:hypothetical protein
MAVYDFLLDFFPLVVPVMEEYPVIGEQLQLCALDLLVRPDAAERLDLLLRLSSDLGVLDPDVLRYLQRSLQQIREGRA